MSSEIQQFFAGKTLFITGGSGFIGKVLIEKFLRCCPELKKIYLLFREKKGISSENRFKKIFGLKLFERVVAQRPQCHSVIEVLDGNLEEDRFSLSDVNYEKLVKEVNVVIHSAATIRFDEKPRLALTLNVLTIRRLIQLCSRMEALAVLVHVSTAYTHCDLEVIDEVIYPSPVAPEKLLDAMQWLDDDMLEMLFRKTRQHPNSYTFTKDLAESLLAKEGHHLPIVIIRPSIVGASLEEPFAGWIDNFNGPSGIFIAVGTGFARSLKGSLSAVLDVIPVDVVVNLILATGWYHGTQHKCNQLVIYHSTTGSINPFRMSDLVSTVEASSKKIAFECAYRRPNVVLTDNSVMHSWWQIFSHLIPAYVFDAGLVIVGKRPRIVRIYDRLHRTMDALGFFMTNEWRWTHQNTDHLWSEMNDADHELFNFNVSRINWHQYIDHYILGAKAYLLNEDPSGIPKARRHLRKLGMIRWTFNTAVAIVVWRVLIAKSQFALNLWNFVLTLASKLMRFFRLTSAI